MSLLAGVRRYRHRARQAIDSLEGQVFNVQTCRIVQLQLNLQTLDTVRQMGETSCKSSLEHH